MHLLPKRVSRLASATSSLSPPCGETERSSSFMSPVYSAGPSQARKAPSTPLLDGFRSGFQSDFNFVKSSISALLTVLK